MASGEYCGTSILTRIGRGRVVFSDQIEGMLMTIGVHLTPEEEDRLRDSAARDGKTPDDLATELLRADLQPDEDLVRRSHQLLPVVDAQGVFHEDRWQAVLELQAEIFRGRPSLSDEAMTREALYE